MVKWWLEGDRRRQPLHGTVLHAWQPWQELPPIETLHSASSDLLCSVMGAYEGVPKLLCRAHVENA